LRREITSLGPCDRCGKPMFEDKVPVITIIPPMLGVDAGDLARAAGQLNMGLAGGYGGLTPVLFATDVEVVPNRVPGFDREWKLCLRCSAALLLFLTEARGDES
jgi:hypothetical protein